jgi:hypothetical protein
MKRTSTFPPDQVWLPVFFTVHAPSKSWFTFSFTLDAGETLVTVHP